MPIKKALCLDGLSPGERLRLIDESIEKMQQAVALLNTCVSTEVPQ